MKGASYLIINKFSHQGAGRANISGFYYPAELNARGTWPISTFASVFVLNIWRSVCAASQQFNPLKDTGSYMYHLLRLTYTLYFVHTVCLYEGQSLNRSKMDIKRKTCDIRTWKKHLFLDISSANTDTVVPSLYQCVETRSIEVFCLLSQSLLHLRLNLFVINETFASKVELIYATNTSQKKGNIYLWKSFA
jgi:hypothetical protein